MVYIRADMNKEIATGHMMRCLSIADAIRAYGEEAVFIVADNNPVKLLEDRGYSYVVLHSKWNELEQELLQMIQLIRDKDIKCLLVDHYSVTEKYFSGLREYTYLAYIDDLGTCSYPVNLLICYASYYSKLGYDKKYPKELGVSFLLGCSYAPLLRIYQDCPPKNIREKIGTVLILSGGSDPFHIIGKMIEELSSMSFRKIVAVCGRFHTEYDSLSHKYANRKDIRIIDSVPNLKELYLEADLVVSASGSTLYELCAAGTPAISYAFADNQLMNAVQMDEDGLIPYAGDARKDNVAVEVKRIMEAEMASLEIRMEKSRKMQNMVDGKGAERIARELLKNRF